MDYTNRSECGFVALWRENVDELFHELLTHSNRSGRQLMDYISECVVLFLMELIKSFVL